MHEEKETDVAIAATLFRVCQEGDSEAIVLLTGDTDLAPAVRTCRELFPQIMLIFLFPYKRRNSELASLCPDSFSLKPDAVFSHQYPDPLELPDGTIVNKPKAW